MGSLLDITRAKCLHRPKFSHRLYNTGARYAYNQRSVHLMSMFWGLSKSDLKFLMSHRFYEVSDLRYPFRVAFYDEMETSVSYIPEDLEAPAIPVVL